MLSEAALQGLEKPLGHTAAVHQSVFWGLLLMSSSIAATFSPRSCIQLGPLQHKEGRCHKKKQPHVRKMACSLLLFFCCKLMAEVLRFQYSGRSCHKTAPQAQQQHVKGICYKVRYDNTPLLLLPVY